MENLLAQLRHRRGFNPATYLAQKIAFVDRFFQEQHLDSCVLGLSGGIDSAVTLLLLQQIPSLKKILPLVLPIYGNGTTGQHQATELALKQCYVSKIDYKIVDLSVAYTNYLVASNTKNSHLSWANGQLASILRTPCLYYHAALLQTEGHHSIVVGTTNRDEGSYIGFYGKASDGMVDLQPIADLHKSEVYLLAHSLGVIDEIIDRTPRGDVWDNKTDEEMIGAPYWFIEMYTLIKEYGVQPNLSEQDLIIYRRYATAIETLHNTNKHKYQVGLPAHFVDVMPRKVPNGW